MDILVTGSNLLITVASALSPMIALLVGFAGTQLLLQWQHGEKSGHISLESAEGGGVARQSAATASLGSLI
jgi:hypothetical protein